MSEPARKHDVFQAIADPTRRRWLSLLDDQEKSVSTLSRHFAMSRTGVSKHSRVWREAGLVHERKVGRETRYRLDPTPLVEVKDWLSYFERFWSNKMEALKMFVESMDDSDGRNRVHQEV